MLTVSVALFWLVQGLATHSNVTYIRRTSPRRSEDVNNTKYTYKTRNNVKLLIRLRIWR